MLIVKSDMCVNDFCGLVCLGLVFNSSIICGFKVHYDHCSDSSYWIIHVVCIALCLMFAINSHYELCIVQIKWLSLSFIVIYYNMSRLMTKPTKWLLAQFDQRMPRLIWVFVGRTCHFVGFVMRRLISLCFSITGLFCQFRHVGRRSGPTVTNRLSEQRGKFGGSFMYPCYSHRDQRDEISFRLLALSHCINGCRRFRLNMSEIVITVFCRVFRMEFSQISGLAKKMRQSTSMVLC